MWPAAWAVSNYLLSEPDLRDNLSSLSILELGTGTGLVSIAAAMGGAKRVLATDYEPLALELTRYAADNIKSNSNNNKDDVPLSKRIETQLLDLCALEEQPLPISGIDIVIASDIMYEPKTGIAMAHRAVEALRQNCRVIVGDSPGRVRNKRASKAFAVVLSFVIYLSSCCTLCINLLCTYLALFNELLFLFFFVVFWMFLLAGTTRVFKNVAGTGRGRECRFRRDDWENLFRTKARSHLRERFDIGVRDTAELVRCSSRLEAMYVVDDVTLRLVISACGNLRSREEYIFISFETKHFWYTYYVCLYNSILLFGVKLYICSVAR